MAPLKKTDVYREDAKVAKDRGGPCFIPHFLYTHTMRADVIAQLKELNRQFYDEFAVVFADSRGRTEPGLARILAQVKPGARVLDLGCGHGRMATLLPRDCVYVGVDFSAAMLALARQSVAETDGARVAPHFVSADLLDPAWAMRISQTHPSPFDWVLLRAVLHHIPGYINRVAILTRAAMLLAPDGHLAMANWLFLNIPRLRRRVLPWDTIGLTPEDVEEGDYLLDWRREGHGLRYVHLVDEAETRALVRASAMEIRTLYRADGHTNDLTLYALVGAVHE